MKHLLSFHFLFPPWNRGIASGFRNFVWTRWLPTQGWSPIVITVSPPPKESSWGTDLPSQLPPSVRLIRIKAAPPLLSRTLDHRPLSRKELWQIAQSHTVPLPMLSWFPRALSEACRWLPRCEAVLTSSAPFATHILGWHLKRRYGLPWIIYLHDQWSTNRGLAWERLSPALRRANRLLERRLLRSADAIVTHSHDDARELKQRGLQRVSFVPMGVDPELFPPPRPRGAKGREFRLCSAGAFYPRQRPAHPFYRALSRFLARHRIRPAEFRLYVLGRHFSAVPSPLRDYVRFRPTFRRFRDYAGWLPRASALLLYVGGEDFRQNLPTKFYDYLAARRPILALAPTPSEISRLVRTTGTGLVAHPRDPDAIALALSRLFLAWKNAGGDLPAPPARGLAALEIRHSTRKLARMLDRLLCSPTRKGTKIPPNDLFRNGKEFLS